MIKTHGRYSVTIADDGAIRVRPGDWVSKFSAALHKGDTSRIGEYARMLQGKIRPLPDPNRILAGETIYHIPTYAVFHLAKAEKNLADVLATEKRLRQTIEELKRSRSSDQAEIQRLTKEVEHLEDMVQAATGECSDMYSCMGAGMAAQKMLWEAQAISKELDGHRKNVAAASQSIDGLEARLKQEVLLREKLQAHVKRSRQSLSQH